MRTPVQRSALLVAALMVGGVFVFGALPDLVFENETSLMWAHAVVALACGLLGYVLVHQMLVARGRAEAMKRALLSDLDTLEVLIDNIGSGVAYLNPQFNLIRVNGAYARAFGRTRAELAGRNHFELFPHPEIEALFREARDTRQPVALSAHRFITAGKPDADARYWDWSLAPVLGAAGEVEGLVLSLIEVTETVAAGRRQQRLLDENLAQRQLLEAIFAANSGGLAVMAGPACTFRLANPAYRALTPDPQIEVIGRPYAAVWQDAGCEDRLALMRQVAETGMPATVHLEERNYPDGRRRCLSFYVRPLPSSGEQAVLVVLEDNTDAEVARRRADAASLEAQRRANELDVIFAAMAEGVLVYDAQGKLIRINPAAAAIFQSAASTTDRNDLIRQLGIRCPDSGPIQIEDLPSTRALRGETVRGVRLLLDRPGEPSMAILSSASPLRTDGKITGAVAVWHDVTALERVEDDLRRALDESRQRQAEIASLLRASRAVALHREFEQALPAILDACKTLLGARSACLAVAGEEDGGARALLFAPAGGRDGRQVPSIALCAAHERAYRSGEALVDNHPPAGECTQFPLSDNAHPQNLLLAPLLVQNAPVGLLALTDKTGGFDQLDVRLALAFAELAAIALANDHTLRLLETSEERFRAVVENANDAMVTLNNDGQIVFWNRAAQAMFGSSGEALTGTPFSALLAPAEGPAPTAEAWPERLADAWETGGRSREATGLRRDGTQFPLEYSFAAWRSREGAFITASVRDVTDRRQAHQRAQQLAALEERQRLARELHDSVSQALYGIALGANTALTQIDHSRGRTVEALQYVISLADLALTEMRALIFDLRPESLARDGLAAGLAKHIAALRARYGIEVFVDFCDEPAVRLSVKETLYGIAREALHNAVKHSRATQISVRLACTEDALELTVSDNGIGFDPTRSYPGHIGLAGMRERASGEGGDLNILSAPGQGACIAARIPLA